MRGIALVPVLVVMMACGSNPSPAGATIQTTTAPVVRTDITRTQAVSGTITYGAPAPVVVLGAPGVVTWLPVEGTTVSRGKRLYAVDGRPTVLLLGAMPAYRTMTIGTSGPDVKQLEENLMALGYGHSSNLVADGNFTSADASAVRRWQRALGAVQNGIVNLGMVVFSPAELRIDALQVAAGAPVGQGAVIVTTTRTDVHVNVALDTAFIGFVHPGDAVRVTLPDLSSSVDGRVVSIAPTTTVASNPNQAPRPTVAVRVDIDEPRKIQAYDEAPVQVAITLDVHRNVLAVPVLALLAEPGEAYAVRVVHGSTRTLVTVAPGLQGTNGLIEVSGDGLAAGDLVEVPAQ
jgi:peptidoglycan hydrolase-like protein with peptidoglycan-binding domain